MNPDWPARNIDSTSYDFKNAQHQWSWVPVAGIATHVKDLITCSDDELRGRMITTFLQRAGRWRYALGLDAYQGKVCMDFGCGSGVEGLQLALSGNRMYIADINSANLAVATRAYAAFGLGPLLSGVRLVSDSMPFWPPLPEKIDVFLSSGVLHHIPYAKQILVYAAGFMNPGGEARILVYSDRNFEMHGKNFENFVARMDPVGNYADWYDRDKLATMVSPYWEVADWEYLSDPFHYAVARLKIVPDA